MRFHKVWSETFVPGWRAPEHQHPDLWEVMLVTQGTVEVNAPGRQYDGTPGSVFIYPAGTPHWERTTSSVSLKMAGLFWKLADQRQAATLPDHFHDVHGRFNHVLHWIHDLRSAYGFKLRILDGLVDALVFECQREHDTAADARLARVRSFVFQAVGQELTVRKLAGIACMSERHFAREFQRRMQQTPMAYVRKIRLEKASNLIAQSDIPLRDIAREVGFRDEFEFSRVFRREMGYAPGAHRAAPPQQVGGKRRKK
jgi:AraC-like DNA-binding protein/mannose-6-phosphate isomerase-like protein (cupin superfamily)